MDNATGNFTAQDYVDMMADDGDKREIVSTILDHARKAALAHTSNSALRIVKDYLNSFDYAAGIDTSKSHTHCEAAMFWLRKQYMSENLENRIRKEAYAELLEGIL